MLQRLLYTLSASFHLLDDRLRLKRRLRRRGLQHCYITCSGKDDGAGAQAQAVMSTLLYSQHNDIPYVHTPFHTIAHNYDDDPDWVEQWENFFSLGLGEQSVDTLNEITPLSRIHVQHPWEIKPRNNTLFITETSHFYADCHTDKYPALQANLRHKFDHGKSTVSVNTHDNITVALHVRRGDVSDQRNANRYTSNNYVLNILNTIKQTLTEQGLRFSIHVYSQGENRDFEDIQAAGAELHLNSNTFDTVQALADADILLMAKSSFSYTAALLCKGVVIYQPFWHQPLPEWIRINRKGNISADKLKHALGRFTHT